MFKPRWVALAWTASLIASYGAPESSTLPTDQAGLRPMIAGKIDRPLRYLPDGESITTVNGEESFNRPLYGGGSAFRVDAGDRPEFSFYLPGAGGNVRLGFTTGADVKWLDEAERVEARYQGGLMIYRIQDPLLQGGFLQVTALSPKQEEGLWIEVVLSADAPPIKLHLAYGGISGVRGERNGDIGCERLPVREFFKFKPENCRGNRLVCDGNRFGIGSDLGTMVGVLPEGGSSEVVDASNWNHLAELIASAGQGNPLAVVHGKADLAPRASAVMGFHFVAAKSSSGVSVEEVIKGELQRRDGQASGDGKKGDFDLADRFRGEQELLKDVAGRVSIRTPDPFVNAAMPALLAAADAVWDERGKVYLHGGVAWRVPLLGWRVSYAGDVFGWHDRTRAHFDRYAAKQDCSPIPDSIPDPEESARLSRNETALHSNGDLTRSHYDMNLVGIDAIFRHLLWTGDLEYARKIWPVIQRHLAWEQRLFRREFGAEHLPLYEAYACIWASDALAYHGGGATHATAYNLYHHRMAARIARLIGEDPSALEAEAGRIQKAMHQFLWLEDKGWYAE